MKPITEEQRKQLISACKEEISRLKDLSEQHEFLGSDYLLEETNNDLLRQEIALASLTAESVRQFIYNNPYEEGYTEWVDCNEEYYNGVPSDCRRIVYTAPPVPVIKLPDELTDLVNAVDFYNAVKAENPKVETGTWKDADEWIKRAAVTAALLVKRLNGLGE